MFIELLKKRRSIRQFQDKPVEQEKIDILIEAILRSPSSKGSNPWEFVVVTDPQTMEALSQLKPHGSSFIKNAPLAVVVCADAGKSDVWVEDCSIAALILHLQATDLGLGSCWVQVRRREHGEGIPSEKYVKNLLGLSREVVVEAVVAIGYGREERDGHPHSSLLYEKVRYKTT